MTVTARLFRVICTASGSVRATTLGCVLLTACAPSVRNAAHTSATADPPGRLVIVGGALRSSNEAVYRAILNGRDGSAPLCVIPTASGGDPERTIAGAVAVFEDWGGAGAATGIPIWTADPAAAHDPLVAAQIRGCSGFYFTGGVQSRIVTVFRPNGGSTPAYEALMSRFRGGAVVAGSSAGAAIMSDPMIAAGSTTGALASGVQRGAAESDEADDAPDITGVSIVPGLGFLRTALVDQHFLARGRVGRLATAILDLNEYDLGFGIDENTALVVDGHIVQPAGLSGVVVIDARGATRSGPSAIDLRLHLISAGDSFDMDSRVVTRAAGRTSLAVATDTIVAPDEPFARWAFLHLLHQFARSPQQSVTMSVPGAELTLRKGPDFTAYSGTGTGVQDLPETLSITGLRLDVTRRLDSRP